MQQAKEKPVLESRVAAPAEQTEEGAAREGARRRGRRGGRRERERRDQIAQNGEVTASSVEEAKSSVEVTAEQVAPARLKPSEYIAYPAGYEPPLKPTEYIAYPEVPSAAEPVSAVSQPVVEAVPAEVESAAVVAQPVAPVVSAATGEGLIQIETDPAKFGAVAQAPVSSQAPAPRRRQRPREVYVENEPRVKIETQRPQA